MKRSIDLVDEFHEAFSQARPETPVEYPDARQCFLRVHLLQEELGELALALFAEDLVDALDALADLQYVVDGTFIAFGIKEGKPKCYYNMARRPQMPRRRGLHVLADLQQKVWMLTSILGSASCGAEPIKRSLENIQTSLALAWNEFGLACVMEAAVAEVHRSNMSKLVEGKPFLNGAGRISKGPDYSPPDLAKVLADEGVL